ncbi:SH3 domain-containing protein [Paraburkholderia sp. CNPSo 3274]|uniref:SH3 domain-containing protein n=1 Tax=Paraburkholderia sp. CNPSo 3274 TaxID=2940932 RepID=UPI0020B7B9F4|nr:SH3 domain-containing protein [Paraburkholderia sp. CNPSo 3274]MCP3705732.1 SH3 domain-containing protein [Paraburkholderia sp. CNPSo 3274]
MSKRFNTRLRALVPALASAYLATGLVLASSDASAQSAAYTSEPVDLYAGPSGDYPVVAELGPGQPVTVMGCVGDYSWCDVTVPGLRGWVYGGYLSYPYQGNYVPLTDYGAEIGLPIVAFSLGAYWGSFYRDRPWYGEQRRWEHVPPPERGRPPAAPAWHGAPGRPAAIQPGGGGRPSAPNEPMRGAPPPGAQRPPGNGEQPGTMRPHEAGHPPEQQQFGGRPPAVAPAQGYARPPESQPQGGMRAPGPAPQQPQGSMRPPAPAAQQPQGRPAAPPQGGQSGHGPSQGGERGNERQTEH